MFLKTFKYNKGTKKLPRKFSASFPKVTITKQLGIYSSRLCSIHLHTENIYVQKCFLQTWDFTVHVILPIAIFTQSCIMCEFLHHIQSQTTFFLWLSSILLRNFLSDSTSLQLKDISIIYKLLLSQTLVNLHIFIHFLQDKVIEVELLGQRISHLNFNKNLQILPSQNMNSYFHQ